MCRFVRRRMKKPINCRAAMKKMGISVVKRTVAEAEFLGSLSCCNGVRMGRGRSGLGRHALNCCSYQPGRVAVAAATSCSPSNGSPSFRLCKMLTAYSTFGANQASCNSRKFPWWSLKWDASLTSSRLISSSPRQRHNSVPSSTLPSIAFEAFIFHHCYTY